MPVRAQAWPVGATSDGEIIPYPESASTIPVLISRPDVLDLESAVAQAELVLAVRLTEVTETKIVHGGTNVQVTEQFRFEPVRVLKGIFARESLLLTGQDLGIYRFAGGSERLAPVNSCWFCSAGKARTCSIATRRGLCLSRFRVWMARTTRCSRQSMF